MDDDASPTTQPDQIAAVMSHKWLDPRCAWSGCQSLVWKHNLEAVVKAADWLSICAQTTGGVAGADQGLQDAITAYVSARDAFKKHETEAEARTAWNTRISNQHAPSDVVEYIGHPELGTPDPAFKASGQ